MTSSATRPWAENVHHQRALAEIWGGYVRHLLDRNGPESLIASVACEAFHLAGLVLDRAEAA